MSSADEITESVIEEVRRCFADFSAFDRLVAPQLREAAKEVEGIQPTAKIIGKSIKKYFDVEWYKSNGDMDTLSQIELIMEIFYTILLMKRKENHHLIWPTTNELLKNYPSFSYVDEPELSALLKFRNAVAVALVAIPAHRNKARHLKIGGRLEGCQKNYITGSGQSLEVDRRVHIYETEGGVEAEKREPRARRSKAKVEEDDDEDSDTPRPTKRPRAVKTHFLKAEGMQDEAAEPLERFVNHSAGTRAARRSISAPASSTTHELDAFVWKQLPAAGALLGPPLDVGSELSLSEFLSAPLASSRRTQSQNLPLSSFGSSYGSSMAVTLRSTSSGSATPHDLNNAPMLRECSLGVYTALDLQGDIHSVRLQFQQC